MKFYLHHAPVLTKVKSSGKQ